MQNARVLWLAIACAIYCSPSSATQDTPAARISPSQHRTLLDRYCVTCHNEKLNTAGLLLDQTDVSAVSRNAATWEKVLLKLRTRAMPPAGMPRPDPRAYDSFAAYLESALDRAAAANPNPGRPAIHRAGKTAMFSGTSEE